MKNLDRSAEEVWAVYREHRHMWIYRAGGIAELHSGSFSVELLGGQLLDLDQILGD